MKFNSNLSRHLALLVPWLWLGRIHTIAHVWGAEDNFVALIPPPPLALYGFQGSNFRPQACTASALPTEQSHRFISLVYWLNPVLFSRPTTRLQRAAGSSQGSRIPLQRRRQIHDTEAKEWRRPLTPLSVYWVGLSHHVVMTTWRRHRQS